jgi:hypothetical protein
LDSITDECVAAVKALDGVSDVEVERRKLTVTLDGGSKTAVLQALESTESEVRDFSTEETLLRRRLWILLSGSYGVEEDKGTASAVPDTNDSVGCVWVGIGRSGPAATGSLA